MLPLFPLNLIVYPDEVLNLYIFEPRYQQLIGDCIQNETTFGIPVFLDKKVQEYGTEIQLLEVVKKYPDGRMDIRSQGKRIFRIDSFSNPMPDKLHAGGRVTFLETLDDVDLSHRLKVKEQVEILFQVLGLDHKIEYESEFLSYRLGHKVGLSQEQELELLKMLSENDRLEFIFRHLMKTIPVVREMERTRERVRMNGHFREFKPPLDF